MTDHTIIGENLLRHIRKFPTQVWQYTCRCISNFNIDKLIMAHNKTTKPLIANVVILFMQVFFL